MVKGRCGNKWKWLRDSAKHLALKGRPDIAPYPEDHHVTSAVVLSARSAGLGIARDQSPEAMSFEQAMCKFDGSTMNVIIGTWIRAHFR